MARLLQPLWVLLALIFLLEAWLWDHLEPVVARVVEWIPLKAIKRWVAARVARLSPGPTLVVFVIPVALLFPLKLLGVWLLAQKYWLAAVATFGFAKLAGLGVTAFLFDVTRPKLLRMRWFARLYDVVIALRERARELVEPLRQRIREAFGAGAGSRLVRSILRFRRRIREVREQA